MIATAGEEAYYLSPECVEILQPMLQVFESEAVLDRSVSIHGNISKPLHPLQTILPLPGQKSVYHEMLEEIAFIPRETRSDVAVEDRADIKDRRDRILDSPGDTVLYQSELNECLEGFRKIVSYQSDRFFQLLQLDVQEISPDPVHWIALRPV